MTDLVPVAPLQRATTWPNLIQEYLATQMIGCSPRNVRQVNNILTRFGLYLSKSGSTEPMVLARFPEYLTKKGCHPNTINANVQKIRTFLRWCFKMGFTRDRHYEYIPSVKGVPYGEPKIITQTEYDLLVKNCDDRDLVWGMVLAFHTGLRLGDCCNLRWANVDTDRQLIETVMGKTARTTGHSTKVPYTTGSDLYYWIIDLKNEADDDGEEWVSPSLRYRYSVDRTCISRYYTRLFHKVGLGDKSFKHFRCTFESRLANSGMNLAMAAKITGRSDPRSLMRYVRVDIEAAREGVAKAMEIHNQYEEFK